jgi:ABC-type nitrate/sulfonate/bicarbonate transport system permease component
MTMSSETTTPVAGLPRQMLAARRRALPTFAEDGGWWGAGAVVTALALWELAWQMRWIDPLFVSGPSAILQRMWFEFTGGGTLLGHIAFSAQNFLYGFSLAVIVAVPLGIVLGWYRIPRLICEPFISGFYSTPRIALVPLIVIWLGIGFTSNVFIVFLSAFFPILVNTIHGVKTTDRQLLRTAASFCATEWAIFATLVVPACVPFIVTGLRQGVAHGLIGVVVGEFLVGSRGIGYIVGQAGMMFQTDLLFAAVIIIAGTGIGLQILLTRVERHFERWRPKN